MEKNNLANGSEYRGRDVKTAIGEESNLLKNTSKYESKEVKIATGEESNTSKNTSKYEGKEVKTDIEEEFNLSNTWIEEHKRLELKIDIKEKLEPASKCCIYRVPINLRKINEEAYTPEFISIGPFHYGDVKLANMEKQKIRYKKDFGERVGITEAKWQSLINFVKDKEQEIRDHYEDTSLLPSRGFIIMILYDAIFIIELFLKYKENKNDFLLNNPRLKDGIWLDLQLIENQLPFLVLKELYNLAFHASPTVPFDSLCYEFLDVVNYDHGEFQHFVDLRRNTLVNKLPTPVKSEPIEVLPASAVKLHESGVKFKSSSDDCLLNIKFHRGRRSCIPCIKVDELQIPHVTIEDNTECLFRNMMALEQCHYPFDTHICNYIDLMDSLINCERDVDLLVDKGIISNLVGEHAAVARMFNKLCLQITLSKSSCYKDIIKDLKEQHGRWWNRTTATLMTVYFSNLWRGTGTIVAIILLVLTLLQTVYTMGA